MFPKYGEVVLVVFRNTMLGSRCSFGFDVDFNAPESLKHRSRDYPLGPAGQNTKESLGFLRSEAVLGLLLEIFLSFVAEI